MPIRTTSARNIRLKAAAFLLLLSIFSGLAVSVTQAQALPEPRRETLLNGLRLVLWQRNNDDKVTLKLRIHSGAAFDLAAKAGTMALLGDTLFHDPTTREFVEKDLGGNLDLGVTHDTLTVTLSGQADSFEQLAEVLRSALLNPTPEAERVNALREARVKALAEAGPAETADEMALARFFGSFPYGRPSEGVAGELAKVDRTDVIFLRERFLNPNNATLIVAGKFDSNRAFRVMRQLMGNWRKSDAVIPSTFRQPDAPDDRVLVVNRSDAKDAEVRLVVRGVTRNDRDYATLALLADIARRRWETALPELPPNYLSVRQEAHTLPGFLLMSGKVSPEDAGKTLQAARTALDSLAADGPTQAELDRARAALTAQWNKQAGDADGLATIWLDADTYRLPPWSDQVRVLNGLTVADLKKTAFRLFRAVPVATLALGPADKMRSELEKTAKVEIYGAKSATPAPSPTPAAPVKPTPAKP